MFPSTSLHLPQATSRTCIGVDLVQVSRIRESCDRFGDRFKARIYTEGELVHASAVPRKEAARLAACFAAKEAAIKAFDLSEAGFDWRDAEVVAPPEGGARLVLHGDLARRFGDVFLTLSCDDRHAMAVVVARISSQPLHQQ